MSNQVAVMLRDLIEYVRHPYPWHLAPMGYVRELRQIGARGRDLAPEWRDHLRRSRQFISEIAEARPRREAVLVVGSGNLLDVPLDALRAGFRRVVLLDILHSAEVRRAVRDAPNVELLCADVTGVARPVFRATRRRDASPPPKSLPPDLSGERFDLVVSVNLLSQLAVIPCAYLRARRPAPSADELSAFSRDLVETHLRWIQDMGARVCLITDVERIETFTDDQVVRKDIVEGVALPTPDAQWDWRIAPRGGVFRDREVVHKVQAYQDFRGL